MFEEDDIEYREYSYPVSVEESCRIKDSYESEAAAAKKKMRSIFTTCLEECDSTPAKCGAHKLKCLKILRALYTGGPWVPYRPAAFVAEINKMFDNDVDVQEITERVAKEIRSHNRDCLCTFGIDDDVAEKQLKSDVRAMYDKDEIPEDDINKYIKDKREERIRFMSTSKQAFLWAICETRPDDPKVLEIVKSELCNTQCTDSKRLKEFKTKWASMIDAGKTWTYVHGVMIADVEELKQGERDQEEIRWAQIALEREKTKKEEAKRAKEARKAERAQRIFDRKQILYSNHSATCAGCQNIAVPDYTTGAVLRCQVCKGLVERELQETDSYYCSRRCARTNGKRHMLEKHPCTAGDACVNPGRHAFEVFSQYCPGCWDKWGIVSYICNLPCYDKNWADHWTKTHPCMEEEFNKREAIEKSFAKLEEESGSGAEGSGKEVGAAFDLADEMQDSVKGFDVEDHDITDA